MSTKVAPAVLAGHPVVPDIASGGDVRNPDIARSGRDRLPDIGRPHMAKVEPQNPDATWNERIGAAIQRAVLQVFETNKAAARTLGVDDAEFGKWLGGGRRPQFDLLFAYAPLRKPLVLSLAQLAGARISTRVDFPEGQ